MSAEESKAFVRRFFDTVNSFDLAGLADELLAPDYRLRFDSVPEMDRDQAVRFFQAFFAAFPGITHVIEDQLAEGDRVATRIVVRGTHGGDFMGIPPTGREVAIKAINIHRVVDGRIVEQWVVSDGVGLLQQLGVMAAPAA
jgi:steroid delta-isomerase-like uncharacterized protein